MAGNLSFLEVSPHNLFSDIQDILEDPTLDDSDKASLLSQLYDSIRPVLRRPGVSGFSNYPSLNTLIQFALHTSYKLDGHPVPPAILQSFWRGVQASNVFTANEKEYMKSKFENELSNMQGGRKTRRNKPRKSKRKVTRRSN